MKQGMTACLVLALGALGCGSESGGIAPGGGDGGRGGELQGSGGGMQASGGEMQGVGGAGGAGGAGGTASQCAAGETRACFDGDPGAVGVGVCMEGVETCGADGSWEQSCVGQVLPGAELCHVFGDEDCDGIRCSERTWHRDFDATDDELIEDMITAADGSIYVLARVRGSVTIDGTVYASFGGYDLFLFKLDGAGSPLWDVHFNSSGDHGRSALSLDPQGNIVVAGTFAGTLSLAGQALTALPMAADIFIARYSPSGVFIDSALGTPRYSGIQSQQPSGAKYVRDVTVLSNGTIVVTGRYAGHWGCIGTLQACTPEAATADEATYVRAFNTSLAPIWMRRFDTPGTTEDHPLAITAQGGNAVVNIHHVGLIVLGPGGVAGDGTVTAALDGATGVVVWSHDVQNADLFALATLANGDIVSAGIQSSASVANRHDSGGNIVVSLPQIPGVAIHAVSEDSDGDVLVTGNYNGAPDFGVGPITSSGNSSNILVAKATAGLQFTWARGFAGNGWSVGESVGALADDSVLVAGYVTAGNLNIGTAAAHLMEPAPGAVRELFIAAFHP